MTPGSRTAVRWMLWVVQVLMIFAGGFIVLTVSRGSPWYLPGVVFLAVGVGSVTQPAVERLRWFIQRPPQR